MLSLITKGRIRSALLIFPMLFMSSLESANARESYLKDQAPIFTARDAIEMQRVVNFGLLEFEAGIGETAKFSPTRDQFVILTRLGDVDRNRNVERLILFASAEVLAYLESEPGGSPPVGRVLVEKESSENSGKISDVKWLNDVEIGFIAEGSNSRSQVFTVESNTGRLEQITDSSDHVVAFSVAGDTVVYYSRSEVVLPDVLTVEGQSVDRLLYPDDVASWFPLIEVNVISRSTGSIRQLQVPRMRIQKIPFGKIWASPSGRYAILAGPAIDAPAHWSAYEIPDPAHLGYTSAARTSDPTSWSLRLRTQYYILDLKDLSMRPLLDAPIGWAAARNFPVEVLWMPDELAVVVSNTFLPLAGVSAAERAQRQRSPALAYVAVQTGESRAIEFLDRIEPRPGLNARERAAEWSIAEESSESGISVRLERRFSDGGQECMRRQIRRNRWATLPCGQPANPLLIERREGPNERPKVYAWSERCSCRKLLFDPAPRADRFTWGSAELVRWTDGNSIEWKGQVVYPPGYVTERRYPLVVQTHGMNPRAFLLDGHFGTTTAMSARALASAGLVVLQVEDNRQAKTRDEREADLFAEGYRAGIQSLVDQGTADPARIGLIAFSRTGLSTVQLLATHPDLLAAVTIADAAWWTYSEELLSLNVPLARGSETGPSPYDIGLAAWAIRNPLYRLAGITTAVRLEANGPMSLLTTWEQYAVLQHGRRPVELVFFPVGDHQLYKPQERLGSQGGNVDWFRFWLQDYEDPDPTKEAQYFRWRELRTLRETILGGKSRGHDDLAVDQWERRPGRDRQTLIQDSVSR